MELHLRECIARLHRCDHRDSRPGSKPALHLLGAPARTGPADRLAGVCLAGHGAVPPARGRTQLQEWWAHVGPRHCHFTRAASSCTAAESGPTRPPQPLQPMVLPSPGILHTGLSDGEKLYMQARARPALGIFLARSQPRRQCHCTLPLRHCHCATATASLPLQLPCGLVQKISPDSVISSRVTAFKQWRRCLAWLQLRWLIGPRSGS